MLRVTVSTRRLRSASGAIVLKMVASRSEACPSRARRRRQQLGDSHVVERRGHPLDDGELIDGILLRLHHLHDDLRIQVDRRGG
jgi:hypothetical protein